MTRRISTIALAGVIALAGPPALRAETNLPALGVMKAPSYEQAKSQTKTWLKSAKPTFDTLGFETIWDSAADRSLLDRVAESLALAEPEAAKLVAAVRDPASPAPTSLPEFLKDAKRPAYLRANVGLY